MYLHGTRYLFFHTVGVEVGKTGLGYYAGHLKLKQKNCETSPAYASDLKTVKNKLNFKVSLCCVRYEEGLWDPQGKPPSGRFSKSVPPVTSVKSNLPPRFQRRPGDEPARRLDSENSVVSDWSLEVEEEEERRSLNGASPFPNDERLHHYQHEQQHYQPGAAPPPSGPGVIRLAAAPADHTAPMPHPAWRSMEHEQLQQRGGWGGYHSLPPAAHHEPRHLYDPHGGGQPARSVRQEGGGPWADRQTSPDYPGPPFPNARIPMPTSRQVMHYSFFIQCTFCQLKFRYDLVGIFVHIRFRKPCCSVVPRNFAWPWADSPCIQLFSNVEKIYAVESVRTS
jgi:hypothetical protein